MPLKRFASGIALFLIILSTAAAAPEGIDFSIRFYDKQIYFPDSSIRIKAMVTNNTASPYRFNLADRRIFTLDFEAVTMSNRMLPHAANFTIQRGSNQPVFFREVSIAPGEEFAFIEDLTGYVEIGEPGAYVVSARFYPDLATGNSPDFIASNRLTLSIRPGASENALEGAIDEETGAVLRREALPPDQVVAYTLRARQKSQWDKFFLYLDIESLLNRDPARQREYTRYSEERRRRMIEEFRENLKQERVDTDIIQIPASFEIIRTAYTPSEGSVQVVQRFRYPDYTEIKEYTYHLRLRDTVWYIYNYEVRNLGTE